MSRSLRVAVATGAALLAATAQAAPLPATPYATWTSVDATAEIATGLLDGVSVTLSGGDLSGYRSGNDLEFRGGQAAGGLAYTLSFGAAVLNPVFTLTSLASTLTFSPGTLLTLLNGDARFGVSGNTVSGAANGSTDGNGSIQLNGTFTSISFTAFFDNPAGDGILLAVGGAAAPTPPPTGVPEPASAALALAGLGLLGALRRRRG